MNRSLSHLTRKYFIDAPIHFKETPGEPKLYLPISRLEFWNSSGKIDVSVLQSKTRLKLGIQQ